MSESMPAPAAVKLLRRAEHVLFVGLLVLGIAQSAVNDEYPVAAGCVAAATLGWYATGALLARRRPTDRSAGVGWLVVLCAGWVALIALSAEFVWLAFPIFLLVLQLARWRFSVPAVAVLAVTGIVAVAWHQGGFSLAAVIGPLIGAAVAVVISIVYRQLRDEADRRARLLVELTAAQERVAAAERYAATITERERVAREIHDTLAQSLASIVLLLRSVGDRTPVLPDNVRDQLDVATRTAREALDDTRALVRTLEPAARSGRPLGETLRRLVADTSAVGVDIGFTLDGEPYPLPATLSVALLRTAQGALGNVVAHSNATHAHVTLTFQPGQVSLDVADDGRGFDPATPRAESSAGTGIGLAAMRIRLAAVGGRLVVETTPGAGTAIGASIPVEET